MNTVSDLKLNLTLENIGINYIANILKNSTEKFASICSTKRIIKELSFIECLRVQIRMLETQDPNSEELSEIKKELENNEIAFRRKYSLEEIIMT